MGPLGAVDGIDAKPFALAIVGGLLLSGVAVGTTVSNIRNVRTVAESRVASVTGTSTPQGGGQQAGAQGAGSQGSSGSQGGGSGSGEVPVSSGGQQSGKQTDKQADKQPAQQTQQGDGQGQAQPSGQDQGATGQQQAPAAQGGSSSGEVVPVRTSDTSSSGNGDVILHVVASGESIEGLAVKYGSSVEAILSANGLEGATSVPVGTRLVIPVTKPASPDAWGLG